jgi:hypothetical protein
MNRRKTKLSLRTSTIERLEDRALLSASGLMRGAQFSPPKPTPSFIAAAGQISHSQASQSANSEVHLTATLTGTSAATGAVSYESETDDGQTKTSLVISISGEKAGAVVNVSVVPTAGATAIALGSITVGADGTGKLVVSSNPKAANQFPAGVPTLAAGASVTLDDGLSGTLATATHGGDGDGHEHDGGDSGGVCLTATLSGTGTTATGTVSYHSETDDGVTNSSLVVSVSGEKTGTVINVSVVPTTGATPIALGTITVGADGTGKLVVSSNPKAANQFPAGFPTLAAGASVTLDDGLSGALAVPAAGSHGGQESESGLSAKLTGTGAAIGKAFFHSETDHGLTLSTFAVKVSGATAGAVLNVSVSADGVATPVLVGTITVGGDGTGSLVFSTNPIAGKSVAFPANFPTLVAGGMVSVTDSVSGATIVGGSLASHDD